MKQFIRASFCICFIFALLLGHVVSVYANTGDIGFFGGITEGKRLPKTTEQLLATAAKKNSKNTYSYSELVFLSGEPVAFNGLMTVTNGAGVSAAADAGTYTETYQVTKSDTTPDNLNITRNLSYDVKYRKNGTQTIKDYSIKTYRETLKTDSGTYNVDATQSFSNISIIEDKTPGVTYYKGDISQHIVYYTGTGANRQTVTVDTIGVIYGYNSAWSTTETHRLDVTVTAADWSLQYQLRPSVSVNKILQYSENEPTAISFSGNYREVTQNLSGAAYNIFVKPLRLYDMPNEDSISIKNFNTFEQLIAPDTEFLRGHAAWSDITKLFAMQVFDGDPKFFVPSQAMTRAQFVTAVAKAIKLPTKTLIAPTKKNPSPNAIAFPDVLPERPDYPYIMAAFEAGLAEGRSNGYFDADKPITKQEAVAIVVKALGLENLGLDPTPVTVFTDDSFIGNWAKQSISAAYRIGLAAPDSNGRFNPTVVITKAESAAFLNKFLEYMREGLPKDYTEHIMNYVK